MPDTVTITRPSEGAESPLVAVGDIAELAGVKPGTPDQWSRRYPGFPRGWRTSGGMVWLRSEVKAWLRETGRS